MKGSKAIISKELKRIFQDKKLIFSLFILPAILMIGIYTIIGHMESSMINDVKQYVSRVYIKNAPDGLSSIISSSEFSKTADITYLNNAEETDIIKDEILDGSVELLVVFDELFSSKVEKYENEGDAIPTVHLFYNTTGNYSQTAKSNFETMVLNTLTTSLLAERFGNLELLNVFQIDQTIIVDEDKANGEFFAMMLPYLITFMLFAGSMSLGVDAITGEKERGTMASMLLAPIKRQEIVVGKLVSLSILSGISAAVYAVAMIFALPMMTKNLGSTDSTISVRFSIQQIVMLLVIMIVMVFLYVSLISVVAVFAKTVKEANTYVSPLYIVVLLAGLITMFQGGVEKPLYLYAIPVYGNALSIQNLMINELTMVQFLLTIGGTLLAAVILTICLTKAFNSEKVMFNA